MRKVNATLAIIMLLALMAGTAGATLFPLDNTAYVIQGTGGSGNTSWLTTVDLSTDPWTFDRILPTPLEPTPATWPVRINNLGFRVEGTGGLLYATQWTGNATTGVGPDLITIDADGNINVLTTSGAALVKNLNSGDISTDGNYMYLTIGGGGGANTNLYTIDLSDPLHPVSTQTITGSFSGLVNDFAYYNGLLYGGDQDDGELAILNPATGIRTDVSLAGLPTGTAFGGAYFGPDGTLYLYENSTGDIYPVTDVTGTPTLGTVLADGPTSVDVDAAAYAGVPVPEPATMLLLGSGLIGLAGIGRKKFNKKS